ncbi:MAG: hypothetical protein JWR84_263 [Caulobacter sp.]|nr:hypothetical protein [Caulobacter sp.]
MTALVHVTGGMVAIVAGPVSLLAPKGRWLHRKAGTLFYWAMLVMAGVALVMASIRVQKVNIVAAALTLYLVVTAWSIVKTRAGTLTRVERWGPWWAAAVAVGAASVGALVAVFPGRLYEGDQRAPEGAVIFLVFAVIASLATATDLWTLRRGGLAGAARISRHLWRMCLALFVAIGSFASQAPLLARRMDLEPPPSLAIFGPALAVLALMAFWLIRVRFARRYRPATAAA